MKFLQHYEHHCITDREAACLFGNIEEIYEFSRWADEI